MDASAASAPMAGTDVRGLCLLLLFLALFLHLICNLSPGKGSRTSTKLGPLERGPVTSFTTNEPFSFVHRMHFQAAFIEAGKLKLRS